MPTCASRIMLTSLAPSPMARVMGCSLEAFINFTICRNTNPPLIRTTVCHFGGTFSKGSAALSPVLSAAAPCDSRARRYSCGRCPERRLCSCRGRRSPGWALTPRTEWPRRWSDRSRCSRPTTWKKISRNKDDKSIVDESAVWSSMNMDCDCVICGFTALSVRLSHTRKSSVVWGRSCSARTGRRADSAPLCVS